MEFRLISTGKDDTRQYFALCEISYGEDLHRNRSLIGYEIIDGRLYLDLLFIRLG